MARIGSTAGSSSTSTSTSSGARDTLSPPIMTESPDLLEGETCRQIPSQYHPDCPIERTCRSCLTKRGCIVSAFGWCEEQSFLTSYPTMVDYRQAFTQDLVLPNATRTNPQALDSDPHNWFFPSLEATYCPPDDAVCRQCIDSNFFSPHAYIDNRFCVGAHGCVCTMSCEQRMESTFCHKAAPSPLLPTKTNTSDSYILAFVMSVVVVLVPVVCVVVVCVFHVWKQRQQECDRDRDAAPHQQERHTQARPRRRDNLGFGHMSLAGWNNFHNDLVEKENLQLNSSTALYRVAPETPPVQANCPTRGDESV